MTLQTSYLICVESSIALLGIEIITRYDLRWPVIYDCFSARDQYSLEDIQGIYVEVSRTLIELRRCKGFIIKDWEEELSHFR